VNLQERWSIPEYVHNSVLCIKSNNVLDDSVIDAGFSFWRPMFNYSAVHAGLVVNKFSSLYAYEYIRYPSISKDCCDGEPL
jgi:hypothetical protein